MGFEEMINTQKAFAAATILAAAGTSFAQVTPGTFTPDATDDYESYAGGRTPITSVFGGTVPIIAGSVDHRSVDAGDWLDFRAPGGPVAPTSGTKFGVQFGFGDFTYDFTGIGGITGFSFSATAAGVGADVIEFFDMSGTLIGTFTDADGWGPGDGTMEDLSFVSTETIGSIRVNGRETCFDDIAYTTGSSTPGDSFGFPSDDSDVVGSLGFIDDDEVGFFWSEARGDRVTETFTSSLGEITRVVWDFDIVRSSLGETLDWTLLINGVEVTDVSFSGETGPQQIDVTFPAIAASGGAYEVSFEATSEVSPGLGSMTLRYAGDGPRDIEFFGGVACPADIDGDGVLTIFDFLAFQTLFSDGDLAADFDGDGILTIFDFLEFQTQFDAGCD